MFFPDMITYVEIYLDSIYLLGSELILHGKTLYCIFKKVITEFKEFNLDQAL